MNINNSGILKWTAKTSGPLPYVVEQFKWNKWIVCWKHCKELVILKIMITHFKITTHSGENKFRIKQVGLGATPKYHLCYY